jgi:2-methylcitrate dehydratase PrpD
VTDEERYRAALLDWLACAAGGARERAVWTARAAGEGLLARVTAAGAAGHVLDYDDTYAPGVIHASACAAPAALVLGASLGADVAAVLDAYAAGFEAACAVARASHPQLYDAGWHPTAVCGTVGAAVAAVRLLGGGGGVGESGLRSAVALALLRAGGLRAAFGSDGKSLQVGMAASAGVHAAKLAAVGAQVPLDAVTTGPAGFERAFAARWATPGDAPPAVRENWIKPYPCCLATHSTIEAVSQLRAAGGEALAVTVHPLARKAAMLDDVSDGLEAKFSIPYLAAFTLLHGPPGVSSFADVDASAKAFARSAVAVEVDDSLGEWEARVSAAGDPRERVCVEWALGSPRRPLDPAALSAKLRELAGDRLDGALDDPARPAAELLAAIGI